METLFQNNYLTIIHQKPANSLYTYWTTDFDMEDVDYRAALLKYLDFVRSTQAENVLIEASKSTYSVPVETQEWINENIYLPAIQMGVKRLAYVVSKDFFTQLSLELIVEDTNKVEYDKLFKQRFFTQVSEATAWLSNS
jgi:hypothetical protein